VQTLKGIALALASELEEAQELVSDLDIDSPEFDDERGPYTDDDIDEFLEAVRAHRNGGPEPFSGLSRLDAVALARAVTSRLVGVLDEDGAP
jgi:hypothetical protein